MTGRKIRTKTNKNENKLKSLSSSVYGDHTNLDSDSDSFSINKEPKFYQKSMDCFELNKSDTFGIAFPIKDKEKLVEINGNTKMVEDLDFNLTLNYSVLTTMPSELYRIEKKVFKNIVTDKAFKRFQKMTSTIPADWELRQFFVENVEWAAI
jgi:hypothetical protein